MRSAWYWIVMLSRSIALSASLAFALVAAPACSSAPAGGTGESVRTSSEALVGPSVSGTVTCGPTGICPVRGSGSTCTGPAPNVTLLPGGFVWPSPWLFFLHMGSYWAGDGAAMRAADVAAWRTIGTDARFWAPLAEYVPGGGAFSPGTDGTGAIRFGDHVDATGLTAYVSGASAPASPVDVPTSAVQNELRALLDSGTIALDPTPIFVIRLPTNVGTSDCPVESCGSIHQTLSYNPPGSPSTYIVPYAVIVGRNYYEGQNFTGFPTAHYRGQDQAISHEVYEVVTDPVGGAYLASCDGWQEVGDLCEAFLSDPIDGYTIATMWSDKATACVGPWDLDTSRPVVEGCEPGCAKNTDTLQRVCRIKSSCNCGSGLHYCGPDEGCQRFCW